MSWRALSSALAKPALWMRRPALEEAALSVRGGAARVASGGGVESGEAGGAGATGVEAQVPASSHVGGRRRRREETSGRGFVVRLVVAGRFFGGGGSGVFFGLDGRVKQGTPRGCVT
jgi:hypothetical protein